MFIIKFWESIWVKIKQSHSWALKYLLSPCIFSPIWFCIIRYKLFLFQCFHSIWYRMSQQKHPAVEGCSPLRYLEAKEMGMRNPGSWCSPQGTPQGVTSFHRPNLCKGLSPLNCVTGWQLNLFQMRLWETFKIQSVTMRSRITEQQVNKDQLK